MGVPGLQREAMRLKSPFHLRIFAWFFAGVTLVIGAGAYPFVPFSDVEWAAWVAAAAAAGFVSPLIAWLIWREVLTEAGFVW